MKTYMILVLSFVFSMMAPVTMQAGNIQGNDQLVKEITDLVKKEYPRFIASDPQEVTVHFQINAKNEIVVFDTTGKDADTCEKVKEVLNFQQVKFKDAKPLKPYTVQIKFSR